jgi:glucose-6-phosphate isomerase
MSARTALPAWQKLVEHRRQSAGLSLRDLFRKDPRRFRKFSFMAGETLLDCSKQLVTAETMRLLAALARECGLEREIRRLFAGEPVNSTENRAALHMALRAAGPVKLDGRDVTRDVSAVLAGIGRMVRDVHAARLKGATGRPFTDIVNIGIGGSDLGPRLACEALAPYARARPRPHFVSNVDGAALAPLLASLDPATTLIVIASKTFTTVETLTNARSVRAWLTARLGRRADIGRHLCAVSAAPNRAVEFGVPADRIFPMWDWVGGRYSLWSAIGLPIALSVGMKRFDELRAGAHAIDEHFRRTPPARNLPVILGLVDLWNTTFRGGASHAVIPYDERLRLLPAYLQQLEMESLGKRVTHDGRTVGCSTVPVVWGSAGTDGQHAYFQMLHQGTQPVPADFIVCRRPHHRLRDHHGNLIANFLAQTEALAFGMTAGEAADAMRAAGLPAAEIRRLAPHRTFPGNRPTTSIVLDELSPRALGSLIALYEHKVYVQSVIWNVNAFDQWGVELGKRLAGRILGELAAGGKPAGGLIDHFKRKRKTR